MSRFFVPITPDEFRKKVVGRLYSQDGGESYLDPYLIQERLGFDLKVKFDFENFDHGENLTAPQGLLGFQTLPNGLQILGCRAGGDWEHPVYFIIYWDGKKLRLYVPTRGNPWNTDTREAYGNNDVADTANAHKRWPDSFPKDGYAEPDDFVFDPREILEDIQERIQPMPPVRTIESRIRDLVYYGDQDESLELFQATVALCYQAHGLAQNKQAEYLCKWAEEQALASKKDWEMLGVGAQPLVRRACWGR